ncbi:2-dehydropantoate 2-reductase [Alcaligenaceae bacterium]|nr:2-dehydropantoate 2-reductase [Alcaligenaceae bacterium]
MNPNKFSGRIAIVGAGAVGGFVGGKLAAAGYDVTLIDAWSEHVDAIRKHGLTIIEPDGECSIPVPAMHADESPSLPPCSLDIVFICVKLYDTDWATSLVSHALKRSGCVVTLQNSLVESIVASRVGWERTLGCIGSGMYVGLEGPGRIRRSKKTVKNGACVFYVGEAQGPLSPRVEMLADMLSQVDAAQATDNLWGLRWSKLVANAMTSGFSAVCGFGLKRTFGDPACCRVMLGLAAEAIDVGAALGYETENIFGVAPGVWLEARAGDASALDQVMAALNAQHQLVTEDAVSGTAQDLKKGKRTEVDFMNGFVAAKAADVRVSTPLHAEIAQILRRIEEGRDTPGVRHLERLEALSGPDPLAM